MPRTRVAMRVCIGRCCSARLDGARAPAGSPSLFDHQGAWFWQRRHPIGPSASLGLLDLLVDGDQIREKLQAMSGEELAGFVDPVLIEQAVQGLLKF